MNILFIPALGALFPHLLPLITLSAKLPPPLYRSAFLLPRAHHKPFRAHGLNILDIDYEEATAFQSQMRACASFKPDVIVDDFSRVALITSKVCDIPRITIRRTGSFPGGSPRNSQFGHTATQLRGTDIPADWYPNVDKLFGIRPPKTIAEMCSAYASIIPGIPSIEVLPPSLLGDPQFTFAGSLLPQDAISSTGYSVDMNALETFLAQNHDRKIVLFTLGTTQNAGPLTTQIIQHLLSLGLAVVTTVPIREFPTSFQARIYYASWIPMHTVCAASNLIIHHCGSATYQYAILHEIPSICLGSAFHDRDDVAIRLEELGVAKYVPPTLGADGVFTKFQSALADVIDTLSPWYILAKSRLRTLTGEYTAIGGSFDFTTLLARTVPDR